MNAFIAGGQHSTNPQQALDFCGPVARRTHAVAVSCDHDHRLVFLRVAPGRIPHPHEIATRTMYGHRDTRGIRQSVLHSARIEGSACHDLPVAPTGGKNIQIVAVLAALDEEVCDEGVFRNRAGRRDVVGGDVIAKH